VFFYCITAYILTTGRIIIAAAEKQQQNNDYNPYTITVTKPKPSAHNKSSSLF
jgi:hypothetical protein